MLKYNCSKKTFTIIEIIILISIFLLVGTGMRYFLAKNPNPENDPANKTLFSFLNISVCFWNIIHIFVYFMLCIIIDARLCVDRHLLVFIIGVFWYLIVPMLALPVEGIKKEDKNVRGSLISYSDTRIPMLSDFIFNTLGQILYIIVYINFKK